MRRILSYQPLPLRSLRAHRPGRLRETLVLRDGAHDLLVVNQVNGVWACRKHESAACGSKGQEGRMRRSIVRTIARHAVPAEPSGRLRLEGDVVNALPRARRDYVAPPRHRPRTSHDHLL
jgi:hypothetical protein